jgi:hypothetical protein
MITLTPSKKKNWMCFINLSLLSITLNIITPMIDISFIMKSYNYSYRHLNLFNESNDKFGKLNKDCWTNMFDAKCIVKPLVLKATLLIDGISKALFLLSQKICIHCIIIIILELWVLM